MNKLKIGILAAVLTAVVVVGLLSYVFIFKQPDAAKGLQPVEFQCENMEGVKIVMSYTGAQIGFIQINETSFKHFLYAGDVKYEPKLVAYDISFQDTTATDVYKGTPKDIYKGIDDAKYNFAAYPGCTYILAWNSTSKTLQIDFANRIL